jgi:hypothetical protein
VQRHACPLAQQFVALRKMLVLCNAMRAPWRNNL